MTSQPPRPASYLNKKSIIAISAGSVAVAVILAVFLFNPSLDLSGGENTGDIPGSDIDENMNIPEIQSGEGVGQQSTLQPQQPSSQSPSAQTGSDSGNPVIAEVNGQEIHLQELQEAQAIIQAQSGQMVDGSALLDQLITKELLLQEAESRDISVTPQEAETTLEQQITQNGLTVDQFKQRLQTQGTTYQETLVLYQEQITIDELLADEVSSSDLSVSDSEAESFFDENLDAIKGQFGEDTVYEDISDLIKNTVLQQKQQGLVTDLVDQLKSDAEVITYKDRI